MKTIKKITELQKKLATLLKGLTIAKDSAIAIALTLQEDMQIVKFAKFVAKNTMATESELLKKAVEIAQRQTIF